MHASDAAQDPIPNDAFFRVEAPVTWPPRQRAVLTIEARLFFREERPAREDPSFIERLPARPLVLGATLLMLGVFGILFQQGVPTILALVTAFVAPIIGPIFAIIGEVLNFFRHVVVGAPVFEEFAKFGLALAIVSALRLRWIALRLPIAWASGAAFGVFEHFTTYADEELLGYIDRVLFHAGSCGLAMAAFTLLEPLADTRTRWASTVLSSLLHWANNFGAVALSVVAILFHAAEVVDLAWSLFVTAIAYALTIALLVATPRIRPRVERELRRVFPPQEEPTEASMPTAPSPAEAGSSGP